MAKKLYSHLDLSDKKCVVCGKRLKRRIVETYPKADKCYSCSHPQRKVNKITNRIKRESQATRTIES